MAGNDELTIGMIIFVTLSVAVALYLVVSLIRMELRDRKRYKERYDEQGRPNRPGSWGIQ